MVDVSGRRACQASCITTGGGSGGSGGGAAAPGAVATGSPNGFPICPLGDAGRVLQVSYKVCPKLLPTLGSALGYAAYIEVIVTIPVLGLLMMTGHVEKDGSYLYDLIKTAADPAQADEIRSKEAWPLP